MHIDATDDDLTLIRCYAGSRDPRAFERLALRYAPMVYAVAYRVTGRHDDAEDVVQDCMLELARQANTIRTSVAGWMHALATSRARNVIRGNRTRRRYEESAKQPDQSKGPAPWREIEPVIDVALDSLPDDLRVPLVLHYLVGLNQSQVAEQLGISQATVSRRLQAGVEQLRRSLGVVAVALPLSGLASSLSHANATGLPVSVRAAIGKLAISGVSGQHPIAPDAWPWWQFGYRHWFLAAVLLPVVVAVVGYVAVREATTVSVSPVPPLRWGALHDGNTTFVGAIAAAARFSGRDASYAQLMGDSGLAFAVRWYRRDHPDMPDWDGFASFGDEHNDVERIQSSLAMRIRRLNPFQIDQPSPDKWSDAINESLARGIPLIAQDGQRARCCLIVGCDTASASRYLHDSMKHFERDVQGHLLRAAEHYDRLVSEGWVDSVYMLPTGPWTKKKFQNWTLEVRGEEIAMFRNVRDVDAAAIAELQAGLQLLQESPEVPSR